MDSHNFTNQTWLAGKSLNKKTEDLNEKIIFHCYVTGGKVSAIEISVPEIEAT